MKSRILLTILFVSVVTLLTTRCSDDEGVTYSLKDVSSRVTGFSNPKTGPGAELTLNGSQLRNVQRIFIGNNVVLARNFVSHTESAITFNVPTSVGVHTDGTLTDVIVVFNGAERAFTKIEVVPLQAISSFTPQSAAAGEPVTLFGVNFDLVTSLRLGDVNATITSQTPTLLRFTMPAGASTGRITLTGEAGNSSSSSDLISCTANPTAGDCQAGLNPNWGFELGSGDNFDNWSKYNGGTLMTATTNAGEVFRGSRAMKIVRDGTLASGEWRIQLASDLIPMEVGASYTVHVWAKATIAGGGMRVSTAPTALYTGNQAVPTTWTRLAFTFTANETPARIVLDMNVNNTVATTFFIDDVKVVKN